MDSPGMLLWIPSGISQLARAGPGFEPFVIGILITSGSHTATPVINLLTDFAGLPRDLYIAQAGRSQAGERGFDKMWV